jgi:hypothetical protein
MKIYLNSDYKIVQIKDNTFVAGSAGFGNAILYYFVDENGDVVRNQNIDYIGLSFGRSDGRSIQYLTATPYESADGWCFQYIITETDGVLYQKGVLGISGHCIKLGLNANNEIISRQTQGIVNVTANVLEKVSVKMRKNIIHSMSNRIKRHTQLYRRKLRQTQTALRTK